MKENFLYEIGKYIMKYQNEKKESDDQMKIQNENICRKFMKKMRYSCPPLSL